MSTRRPTERARSLAYLGAAFAAVLVVVVALLAGWSQGADATNGDPLLQRCASMALQQPEIVHPLQENRAGIWPHTGFPGQQIVSGGIHYPELPEECSERYARVSTGRLQMIRHGRWVSICGNCVGWIGSRGGAGRLFYAPPHPDIPASAFVYNTCRKDGTFHRVSVWIVNQLNRPATGSVEARSKKWRFPVAVRGNCAHAALSQTRVRKLQAELFESGG